MHQELDKILVKLQKSRQFSKVTKSLLIKSKNREVVMRLLENDEIESAVRHEIAFETFKILLEYDSLDEAHTVWKRFSYYFNRRSSELVDLLTASLDQSPAYL